jgi:hypothetical protein
MQWILIKMHLPISVLKILFSFLPAETNIARGCSKVYQYSGIQNTLQSTSRFKVCFVCILISLQSV